MTTTTKPSLLRRLWRNLMTPVGRRVPVRNGRGAPHGMALLTVMIALALMSAVVTDLENLPKFEAVLPELDEGGAVG
jgi:hypothetical protein